MVSVVTGRTTELDPHALQSVFAELDKLKELEDGDNILVAVQNIFRLADEAGLESFDVALSESVSRAALSAMVRAVGSAQDRDCIVNPEVSLCVPLPDTMMRLSGLFKIGLQPTHYVHRLEVFRASVSAYCDNYRQRTPQAAAA